MSNLQSKFGGGEERNELPALDEAPPVVNSAVSDPVEEVAGAVPPAQAPPVVNSAVAQPPVEEATVAIFALDPAADQKEEVVAKEAVDSFLAQVAGTEVEPQLVAAWGLIDPDLSARKSRNRRMIEVQARRARKAREKFFLEAFDGDDGGDDGGEDGVREGGRGTGRGK